MRRSPVVLLLLAGVLVPSPTTAAPAEAEWSISAPGTARGLLQLREPVRLRSISLATTRTPHGVRTRGQYALLVIRAERGAGFRYAAIGGGMRSFAIDFWDDPREREPTLPAGRYRVDVVADAAVEFRLRLAQGRPASARIRGRSPAAVDVVSTRGPGLRGQMRALASVGANGLSAFMFGADVQLAAGHEAYCFVPPGGALCLTGASVIVGRSYAAESGRTHASALAFGPEAKDLEALVELVGAAVDRNATLVGVGIP